MIAHHPCIGTLDGLLALGVSGADSVGNFNADVGDGSVPFLNSAQGFTATYPNLTVVSGGFWLFDDGSIPTTVGIFAANAGSPAALPACASSMANVGAKSLYQSSFSGATLTNGAKENSGSAWAASSTSDWIATITAVPEPSAYAMAAICADAAV